MSAASYRTDDISSLVIDVGQNSIRAGFSGEDYPKLDVPSVVGMWCDPQDDVGKAQIKYNVGTVAIHVQHPGMEMNSFMKQGMVEDWDIFENVLDYIYIKALGAVPQHHPILMTEPSWVTTAKRERMVEILFEKYNVPALYLGKNASLAAIANGRFTCLLIDSGASHTSVVPIHDGNVLTHAIVTSPLGGDYISMMCRSLFEEQNVVIVPPGMVRSKAIWQSEEPASWRRRIALSLSSLTNSWYNHMVKEVVQDFQSSVIEISETPLDDEAARAITDVRYEFPNGFQKDFGIERFQIAETLFNPIYEATGPEIQSILGVGDLVTKSVGMCDVDIRPAMYGNILLTGGNSNIVGFTERLNHDLVANISPSMQLKVMSCVSASERKFHAWMGGSILTSIGSFHQLLVSRQEYYEGGKTGVLYKCP